ncbi:Lrp/AsnC family transcriptional regulator [Lentzea alba]|uniref:Lrp/AsnC family transcriptional regulator n=1 Tax=Lentzea alba TaxID=2714351 RepID=UPI0039BEDFD0
MTQVYGMDEVDRSLVHALQIHPRAPWSLLGEVLELDPVTVARRWQRLENAGLAWVTAYPRATDVHNVVTAIVEVDTAPGAASRVAGAVARFPWAVNVKETAGGRDLVVNVQAQDVRQLWQHITTGLSTVEGVVAARTHLVTGQTLDGSSWRLRSLDAAQRTRLEQAAATPGVSVRAAWDEVDTLMVTLLNADGRISIRDLAARTGLTVSTAGRRLRHLLAARVTLRCDVARSLSGWPFAAVYFASAPAEKLREIVSVLAAVPEVRSCVIASGPHNLIVDVWLRGLPDVHALEAHLSARLPVDVRDRSVVVRTTKHMGRLLDDDGRCVELVPVDLFGV